MLVDFVVCGEELRSTMIRKGYACRFCCVRRRNISQSSQSSAEIAIITKSLEQVENVLHFCKFAESNNSI